PFLILQSCIFYPICRCQRTLFRLLRERGLGRVFRLLPNIKMVCFAFASRRFSCRVPLRLSRQIAVSRPSGKGLGLTGLEPVTLRLSSACSNQLSYRPGVRSRQARACPSRFKLSGCLRRTDLAASDASGCQTSILYTKGTKKTLGGKGTRTPDL